MKKQLIRDFIWDRLYHQTGGYFCKTSHQLGQISNTINFATLDGIDSYWTNLGQKYPEYAFLTPSEIFQPWYGYTLANYILNKSTSRNIKIIEIGPGTGTTALSILLYLRDNNKQVYDNIDYTACEISPVLADTCKRRFKANHGSLVSKNSLKVVRKSFMDWDTQITHPNVFIIGLEVLDNLVHDLVRQVDGKWAEQGYVQDGQIQWEPIEDKTIVEWLEYYESLEELGNYEADIEHNEGIIYNILKYMKERKLKKSTELYLPTGYLQLLHTVNTWLPRGNLILSDFDSLWDVKIKGINAPIVSQKGKSSDDKLDFDSILVDRGQADIFFPTDFRLARHMHRQVLQRPAQIMKSHKFVETHSRVDWTQTKTGYRPLKDDFLNTSFLLSASQNKKYYLIVSFFFSKNTVMWQDAATIDQQMDFSNSEPLTKPEALPIYDQTGSQGLNRNNLTNVIKQQNDLIRFLITRNETIAGDIEQMEKQLTVKKAETEMPALERNEPDTSILMRLLTGSSPAFDFELIGLEGFPSPICKGKYIRFKVGLNTLNQTATPPKALELKLKIYSAESDPQEVIETMVGKELIKGVAESQLTYNRREKQQVAQFKIGINEVTSHFENGWLFVTVQAEDERIKPYVVERVVILAKEKTCKKWRAERN